MSRTNTAASSCFKHSFKSSLLAFSIGLLYKFALTQSYINGGKKSCLLFNYGCCYI
ncbi:uncharacterized protein DS421_20g682890 [Arachis hypogaea]|nr:uncharacterized protein DS421_20g682890 [Arachis hypogaea]